ncbi:FAD-binding oxidoreductase [Methylophilaceae bacterium Uisw_099_01]
MNTYPLENIEHLSKDTFKIRIKRPDIEIISGQCFNIGLPGLQINREYSIYSAANSKYLDFLIRAVEGGRVSSALQKIKPGDLIEVDGAYGDFCLKDPMNSNQEYLFIATGTGIAPFHSFVTTWPTMNYKLLHGVRFTEECYHANVYKEGSYIPCISKPADGSKGMRVTDYISDNEFSSNIQFYICGNRNMIIDTFEILHNKGISGDNITTEVFF